jgi:hypothetical protein
MTFLHSEYNSKINLSAKQVLEISLEITRDFTPCFSSPVPELVGYNRLTPRELLDIGEEICRDFAPKASDNIPELMLLPVDPEHVYVYWNLGKITEASVPDKALTLRIYSQPDAQAADAKITHLFDVALDKSGNSQHVYLPNPDDVLYSAIIGNYRTDDDFIAIAHSNSIHIPHGSVFWHQDYNHSIADLSKSSSGIGILNQA